MWLNERAERANINFSGILQEALKPGKLHPILPSSVIPISRKH